MDWAKGRRLSLQQFSSEHSVKFPILLDGRVLLQPGKFLHPTRQEVWRLLASSETIKGIALRMNKDAKTIEYHKSILYRELGLDSIALLTRRAIAIGLIEPDDHIDL